MKQFIKLLFTGIIAGLVLGIVLGIIQLLTHNKAFLLLFNMDYIPLVKNLNPGWAMGITFHLLTCITSVVALFYILKIIHHERNIIAYLLTYTIGGGLLFSLTALSNTPPAITDFAAWGYWTFGHAIFSLIVGILIKYGD